MSWILNRAGQGQPEGPYDDAQIIQMIQGGLREGFVCRQGDNRWMPLGEHPPFAQALGGSRQRRASGTLVMSLDDAPPAVTGAAPAAGNEPPAWSAQTAYAAPGGPGPTQNPAPVQPSQYGQPTPQQPAQPGAYGQPPQGHPPAQAAGYGPQVGHPAPAYAQGGVAGPAPGEPPPGWGGAAQALPPVAGGAVPAPAKKGKGMLLFGGLGLVALVGVIVVVVLFMGGGGPKAAKFVPDDVLVFVEFPDSARALQSALGMDFLKPTKVDAEKHLDSAVKGFTEAFKLDKEEAEALLLGLEGVAYALRLEAGKDQHAVLVTFRKASLVEPWLASDRVSKDGKFGSSGERYLVVSAKEPPAPDTPPLNAALAAMAVSKESTQDVLVWFESEGLLAMGSSDLLDDIDSVITKGDGSLADSDGLKEAEFTSNAALLAWVNPDVLDQLKGDEERKLVQGYLNDVAPFTVDAAFVDAGMLSRARGQLKGNRITTDDALPDAIGLELQERLPLGTVAYVAMGSKHTEDGKALRSRVIKQLRSNDEALARQFETSLEQLEKGAGVNFERIVDAIGNEVVFGVVVDPDFKLGKDARPEEQLDKLAGLFLVGIGKEDAANDVVKQLRTKLFEEGPLKATYDVKQQGQGFQGLPKDPKMPTVQVFFHEGRLLVGVGGKQVLAKALLALGGKDSLASDAAHQKAIKSFSAKPRILSWVDSGRVGKATLTALPDDGKRDLEAMEKQLGISHEAVELEGADRMTAAFAMFAESKDEVWNVSLETLNAPSLGLLSVVAEMLEGGAAPPVDVNPVNPELPTVPGGLFLPATGVPQCDGLILMMFQCGERTGDPALTTEARALELRLKTEFADAARKAAGGDRCSRDLLQFITTHQKCTGS